MPSKIQKTNQFRSLIAASGQALPTRLNGVADAAEAPAASPAPRSPGKRTAPDYVQVGVYLPKQLHNRAKVLLIHEASRAEGSRDFSQLVGDLLAAYVEGRNGELPDRGRTEQTLDRVSA